jgi:hypothetical protein
VKSAEAPKKINKKYVQSVNTYTKGISDNVDIMYKAYFPKTYTQSTLKGCYQGTDFYHTISLGITKKLYNKIA